MHRILDHLNGLGALATSSEASGWPRQGQSDSAPGFHLVPYSAVGRATEGGDSMHLGLGHLRQ